MWSPLTWFLILSALLEAAVCDILVSNVISTNTTRLHVVFVYTIAISKCHLGLPEYITVALEQAVEQEPDCDIVLLSNYAECPQISVLADKVNHLIKIDINDTMSVKTERYMKLSREIFLLDNPLWLASALRFFYLEDFMTKYACRELIHIEADNMIYGRMTGIVDALRKDYVGIAATPLTSRKIFITASIFWVANLKSLCDFNNYLLDLGAGDGDQWSNYLLYMKKRGYADKRKNVIRNSKLGGVGPGSINEMSMLGFYKVKRSSFCLGRSDIKASILIS